MKYKSQNKISNHLLNEKLIEKDYLIRDFAFSIIKELPIDDIKKLFNIELINGDHNSLNKAHMECRYEKVKLINQLIQDDCSLLTSEIDIS